MGPDLFAGGAVDAVIGGGLFPVAQVGVDRSEGVELAPFERAVFDVADVAFDLALVLRGAGSGQQGAHAVVGAEALELRVELRIVEVGLEDPGLEVVEHEDPGDPAEVPEGVFQPADEALGILAKHRFGCSPCANDSGPRAGLGSCASCRPPDSSPFRSPPGLPRGGRTPRARPVAGP